MTHDHQGAMVRQVAMRRDKRDRSKWRLAEDVALGGLHAETAVIRFGDGTSEPLAGSLFASTAPIDTLLLYRSYQALPGEAAPKRPRALVRLRKPWDSGAVGKPRGEGSRRQAVPCEARVRDRSLPNPRASHGAGVVAVARDKPV